MPRYDTHNQYAELLVEENYYRQKAELAREELAWLLDHGIRAWSNEYKRIYQRYSRYKKRRKHYADLASKMRGANPHGIG